MLFIIFIFAVFFFLFFLFRHIGSEALFRSILPGFQHLLFWKTHVCPCVWVCVLCSDSPYVVYERRHEHFWRSLCTVKVVICKNEIKPNQLTGDSNWFFHIFRDTMVLFEELSEIFSVENNQINSRELLMKVSCCINIHDHFFCCSNSSLFMSIISFCFS